MVASCPGTHRPSPEGTPRPPYPRLWSKNPHNEGRVLAQSPRPPRTSLRGPRTGNFPPTLRPRGPLPWQVRLLWTAGRRAILTVLTQPLPPGAHVWPAVPGPSAHGWPCSKGLWPGPASALLSFPLWAPRPLPPLRPSAAGRGSGPSLPSLTENCGRPLQVGQGGGPEGQRPRHRLPSIPGEVRSWGLSQDPRRGRAKG